MSSGVRVLVCSNLEQWSGPTPHDGQSSKHLLRSLTAVIACPLAPAQVNPSVGMYAILLAAQMCRDVRLYGFWKDWSGLTPFRYYDRIEPAGAVAAHARRLEADAVLALVR